MKCLDAYTIFEDPTIHIPSVMKIISVQAENGIQINTQNNSRKYYVNVTTKRIRSFTFLLRRSIWRDIRGDLKITPAARPFKIHELENPIIGVYLCNKTFPILT